MRSSVSSNHAKGVVCLVLALALVLFTCGALKNRINEKAVFVSSFGLQTVSYEINMTELYNDYEGVSYEGVALYQVTFTEDASPAFDSWNALPLDGSAELFLESVSDYVTLPSAASGTYKMIDRSDGAAQSDGTEAVTNASLCVYDAAANTAYYLKLDA